MIFLVLSILKKRIKLKVKYHLIFEKFSIAILKINMKIENNSKHTDRIRYQSMYKYEQRLQ
jgi:hypothetical protein